MPLADDIRALRDHTVADLVSAYDYFSATEFAWFLVRRSIADRLAGAGPGPTVTNPVTGTQTTPQDLVDRAPGYTGGYLTEATFNDFLAILEAFVGDLLRLWLTAFPKSLGEKDLKFKDVLEAGDLAAVARRVVDLEVFEVTYKSPRKLFEYIRQRVGLAPPADADIDRLAEAKATRDVLTHNRGVADAEYRKKAGPLARFATGERIDIPRPYHQEVWELIRKVVTDLADGAIAKVPA